ncbi:MAG: tRNA (adenosine(37)-N6)-threonylcarbamoyltransferase complex dimerization subunit type 1 TsaB [Caldilineaceae bacterium]|nr:tRNA (adenosine(37)-N6)-threonylcarbamoyltransferase complex dimerization subunit type 1 TsaB [Caldilineaceae bacterium]
MILALDTATTTASLALYAPIEKAVLAEQTWQARRRQTEDLLPVLQEMMARLALTPAAIHTIAVTTGPGSFTGVRIGISVAKGIALGLPTLPSLIGLPTLCVTAAPWFVPAKQVGIGEICAFLGAGRGRYNWAIFPPDDPLRRPEAMDHFVGNVDGLEADLLSRSHPIWLVGEITQSVAEMAARLPHVCLMDEVSGLRRASQLARLAAFHHVAGNVDTADSLQPLYLREPL